LETHVEREIDPLLSSSIPMTLEIFFQKRAVFCKVISRDTFVEIENASTKLLSQSIKEPPPGVKYTCWQPRSQGLSFGRDPGCGWSHVLSKI
jgi:hypothetical protein